MNAIHNELATRDRASDGGTFERLFEMAVLLAEGMDRGLAERGLTRARAEVIWLLQRQAGTTQRELSQALRCTPRNVTGLVDGLEQTGLVKREQHATDRRATLVNLTPQGRRIAAAMHADYGRAAKELFADLAPSELAAFSVSLAKVLGRLREPAKPARPVLRRTAGRASKK